MGKSGDLNLSVKDGPKKVKIRWSIRDSDDKGFFDFIFLRL